MFETVFVPRARGQAASAIAFSAAAQSLFIGTLMTMSLVFTDVLPVRRLGSIFPVSVPPPRPPEPAGRPAATATFNPGPRTLFLLPVRPASGAPSVDFAGPAPSFGEGVPGGVAGFGVPGGMGPVGTWRPPVAPPEPHPAARPAPAPKNAAEPIPRVKIGGLVQAARLTHQVKPAYPALAKQARVQGTVRLEAVIDPEGAIRNLSVVSGHPLLIQAAVDAVRQWRYQPTYLNDNPVEVLTQIDVNFTLTQ